MKKLSALLLCLMLVLSCTFAVAESAKKEDYTVVTVNGAFNIRGITPEGYRLEDTQSVDTDIWAVFGSEDPSKPSFSLVISFLEEYANVERLNDLSEAEIEAIKATFADDEVEFSETETAYGTKLLVVREAGDAPDYVDFVSIYKGYYIEFLLIPGEEAEEQKLSDEEIQMCIDFLSNLDFIPIEEDEQAGA
jgi:hypothetical protein